MPKGIARQGIASRPGVARHPVASPYGIGLGGALTMGVVQGSTTIQPGVSGILYLWGFGGGAGGASGGTNGGGGGSAGFAAMRITPASQIVMTIAAIASAATNGGATTITVDGRIFTAGGGLTNGQGGTAVGFDVNRTGGASGQAGLNGTAAGTTSGSQAGGGGAAGFMDQTINNANNTLLIGTQTAGGNGNNGGTGGASSSGGGGGAGSTTGGTGGAGSVSFLVIKDIAR